MPLLPRLFGRCFIQAKLQVKARNLRQPSVAPSSSSAQRRTTGFVPPVRPLKGSSEFLNELANHCDTGAHPAGRTSPHSGITAIRNNDTFVSVFRQRLLSQKRHGGGT
jgi:hypothetical protein